MIQKCRFWLGQWVFFFFFFFFASFFTIQFRGSPIDKRIRVIGWPCPEPGLYLRWISWLSHCRAAQWLSGRWKMGCQWAKLLSIHHHNHLFIIHHHHHHHHHYSSSNFKCWKSRFSWFLWTNPSKFSFVQKRCVPRLPFEFNDYKNGPGLLDWFITTIDPGQVRKQLNCIINPIYHW